MGVRSSDGNLRPRFPGAAERVPGVSLLGESIALLGPIPLEDSGLDLGVLNTVCMGIDGVGIVRPAQISAITWIVMELLNVVEPSRGWCSVGGFGAGLGARLTVA